MTPDSRRRVPNVLLAVSVVTLIVAGVGFIVTLMLNAFVFDDYDAYGEVPIPGHAELQLPAGDVNITLHTMAIGSAGGGGLPVPDLGMNLDPPPGVPAPTVTESVGATTSINNDIRRRIWIAHIPEAGTYQVTVDGKVSAYINPTLAFGTGGKHGWMMWVFAGLFGVGLLDLVIALLWRSRVGASTSRFDGDLSDGPSDEPDTRSTVFDVPQIHQDPADGIRIEQLKTLAALRDSGALTEDEFAREKRRLLDGP